MNNSKRVRLRIDAIVLLTSLVIWIILLFNPGDIMTVEHCQMTVAGPSTASFDMLLQMNPFGDLMIGWVLMVYAMMLPKLIPAIHQIYASSFKSIRFRLALVFVLGYTIIWTLAGVVINGFILGANLLMPNSFVPAVGIGIIALVWQFSPLKQRFLNRGHNHRALRAFGWSAYQDAHRFGVEHGLWCVGSGWALMLLPMLMPVGHNVAMIVVAFIMISEHMEAPSQPQWRPTLRLKLLKIIVAQTEIRLG